MYRFISVSCILLSWVNCERLQSLDVSSYKLQLTFNDDTFYKEPYEFMGYAQIKLIIRGTYTTDLKIHAAHNFIKIHQIFLDNTTMTDFDIDESTDILTIGGSKDISKNIYGVTLYINYTSRLSTDDMYGLYRASFKTNEGQKYFALSQLAPNFARRVFPCFDEPSFKTTYQVYVSYTTGIDVFFNTVGSVIDTSGIIDGDDAYETVLFQTTRQLSTYMIGFGLFHKNEFSCSTGENITSAGGVYRVCSRMGTESVRSWAVSIGPSLLKQLLNFTNFIFHDKMDVLAVPHLPVVAEENWGLVTVRESSLLLSNEDSSALDMEKIAMTMSFEFAQMWFGNVATPEWWSICYVSKGLATYLQYLITHMVFPEWELDKQILLQAVHPALDIDSYVDSPPLDTDVETTKEIISKFNKITYLKGASLFRMLKEVIAGYDCFRGGLGAFLTSYSYRTTDAQGMWNLISAKVNLKGGLLPKGKVLKEVLLNWEKYPGYPLLEVTRDGYKTITIQQKGRFMYSGLNSTYQWYVPVSYILASNLTQFTNTTLTQWLQPNTTFEVKVKSEDEEWVMLNIQASGYYRVHYGDMWHNISRSLQSSNFTDIPELNRAQLLDDLFALGRAKLVNYSLVLNFTQYLSNEESHYPWDVAIKGFNYILRRTNDSLKPAILEYVLKLMERIYDTVSWDSKDNETDHVYTMKQIDILTGACHFGHVACIAKALETFERFYLTGNKPHRNVRQLVYCMAMRHATDSSYWDFLWRVYHQTITENEKMKLLSAFGCSQNENQLKTYLQMSLDDASEIKPQDASAVFSAVCSTSPLGARITFEFLVENENKILQRYQDMNCLKNMALDLAEYLTDVSQVDQMKEFFSNRTDTDDEFQPVAKQVLEILDINKMWTDDHLQEFYDYFEVEPNVPPTGSTTTRPSRANYNTSHLYAIICTILVCSLKNWLQT